MTALPPRGAIVVGTDGSKHADLALDWAAEEAQRRHVRLHLIHATNLDWLVSATIISRAAEHAVTDDVLDAAPDEWRPDTRT
jgi:nucleotide-binding universal stress UspA family protein